MARPEGATAGCGLLEKARAAAITIPIVFHTASAAVNLVREAKERGAYGQTNSPDELISLVTGALGAI